MRMLLRSGPLFVALASTLTGCNQSGPPSQKLSNSPAKEVAASTTIDVLPGSSEVVLTVQGMS